MKKLDQKAIAEKIRKQIDLFENTTNDDEIDKALDEIENLAACAWLSHHADELIER